MKSPRLFLSLPAMLTLTAAWCAASTPAAALTRPRPAPQMPMPVQLPNVTFTDIGAGLPAIYYSDFSWGDFDNDGDLDFVVNTVNDYPQLLRCDLAPGNNWIKVRTIGTKSNRTGIGARLRCVTQAPGETKPHSQIDEVRSGGGYFSQNDLRIHFGLGKTDKVQLLEIHWPSGQVDALKDVKVNQLVFVREGEGIVRTMQFPAGATGRPK
jgi:hypothetical protein